jgi:hypothetical protein
MKSVKVDRAEFDTLLGKLLKAPPLPQASVDTKTVRSKPAARKVPRKGAPSDPRT